jgi:hypothetical protein
LEFVLLIKLAMVGKKLIEVVALFSEEEATRRVWGSGIVGGCVLHYCVWLETPDHDGEHSHCRHLGHRGVAKSTSSEWQLAGTVYKTRICLDNLLEFVCCWRSKHRCI